MRSSIRPVCSKERVKLSCQPRHLSRFGSVQFACDKHMCQHTSTTPEANFADCATGTPMCAKPQGMQRTTSRACGLCVTLASAVATAITQLCTTPALQIFCTRPSDSPNSPELWFLPDGACSGSLACDSRFALESTGKRANCLPVIPGLFDCLWSHLTPTYDIQCRQGLPGRKKTH